MVAPCHKFLLQSTMVVALLALSATPAPIRLIREAEHLESNIHYSLLSSLYQYTMYLFYYSHTIDCATHVNTMIQNPNNDLKAILNDTCDLLSFYDSLNAVDESKGKDLHQILEQIVVEACNWTKLIVNTTDSASFSPDGEESCPDFLRKQCVAERAKEGWLESRLINSGNNIRHFIEVSGIAIDEQTAWTNHLPLNCL